ncbi:MAG: hypothetical protein R3Y43_02415 [Alphaproteobacteria bacterium]
MTVKRTSRRKKVPMWKQRLKSIPKFWGISLTLLFGAISLWGSWQLIFTKSDFLPIVGIVLILAVLLAGYHLLAFFTDKE